MIAFVRAADDVNRVIMKQLNALLHCKHTAFSAGTKFINEKPCGMLHIMIMKTVTFIYINECTAKSVLHFTPGRPVHSDTNSASLGSIQETHHLRRRLNHSHFQHCQVLVYTAEWTETLWRERKFPNFETVAKGIRTRAHLIGSPAFYRWAAVLHCMVMRGITNFDTRQMALRP